MFAAKQRCLPTEHPTQTQTAHNAENPADAWTLTIEQQQGNQTLLQWLKLCERVGSVFPQASHNIHPLLPYQCHGQQPPPLAYDPRYAIAHTTASLAVMRSCHSSLRAFKPAAAATVLPAAATVLCCVHHENLAAMCCVHATSCMLLLPAMPRKPPHRIFQDAAAVTFMAMIAKW